MMEQPLICSILLAGLLTASVPLQAESGVATQAVVTLMPKSGTQAPEITAQQLSIRVGDKAAKVNELIPLRGERGGLQLVILIDSSARSGLSLEFASLKNFIQHLPDGAQVGVAYMENGRAVIRQNITPDRNLAAAGLRIPSGIPGQSASPYFCLSDLVKNWPSQNATDRREVLMITDGVDLYYGRRFDPDDPYVQTAISDAQKAGVIVHSIFFRDTGRFDNSQWTEAGAQNYLLQVSDGTGGRAYWQGFGNPVSFDPFLNELSTRLRNQYELGILATPRNKTELQPLKVKLTAQGVKVDAPRMVLVPGSEAARR